MTVYGVGAAVTLLTRVRDSGGAPVDPASITLTIRLPDATTVGPFTLPQVVRDSTGVYRFEYVTTTAGLHVARWVTTGPATVTEEPFEVAPEWEQAGILSLAEAKQQLNIDPEDTGDDEEIAGFIRSVTAICERHAGAILRATHVETHSGGYAIALNHTPVLSVTSVLAAVTGVPDQDVADLDVDRAAGVVRRRDGCFIPGPVRVTYEAGRASISPNIRQAALVLLQHMWETQRGTALPRFGAEETWDPRLGFSIPRRALELLGDQPPGIA